MEMSALSPSIEPFNTLRTYLRLVSIRIRSQMQYRASFLLELLTSALASGVAFLTVALVLLRFEDIGGWRLHEIALLYGSVETAFGLMDMVFSGFDPQFFGRQVRLGAFDQMLLRPVNITLQVISSEFLLRRLGRIGQGLVVLAIGLAGAGIAWTPLKALMVPLMVLSMVAFFGGLFIAGSTITFWTVESIEAMNVLTYGSTEMMAYPMHIYPDWMVRFFTFIVPAIFLNYYPTLFILGRSAPSGFPPLVSFLFPLVGFGVLAASLAFWKFGIRHYQSTGT